MVARLTGGAIARGDPDHLVGRTSRCGVERPIVVGVGKVGAPYERMHSANLRNPLLSLLDEPGLDEPETFESLAVPTQAAIATTQTTAANPVLTGR